MGDFFPVPDENSLNIIPNYLLHIKLFKNLDSFEFLVCYKASNFEESDGKHATSDLPDLEKNEFLKNDSNFIKNQFLPIISNISFIIRAYQNKLLFHIYNHLIIYYQVLKK